jgi:hypothetical protein
MTMTLMFAQARFGRGLSARMRRAGVMLRRFGAAWMRGLHEQRRREASRIIAHERYLASLDRAVPLEARARPKVVPLCRSPAPRPSRGGTI